MWVRLSLLLLQLAKSEREKNISFFSSLSIFLSLSDHRAKKGNRCLVSGCFFSLEGCGMGRRKRRTIDHKCSNCYPSLPLQSFSTLTSFDPLSTYYLVHLPFRDVISTSLSLSCFFPARSFSQSPHRNALYLQLSHKPLYVHTQFCHKVGSKFR